MDREGIIEQLINDDIEEMMSAARDDNFEVIAYTLELGFKGYVNYTDEELATELAEHATMKEYLNGN